MQKVILSIALAGSAVAIPQGAPGAKGGAKGGAGGISSLLGPVAGMTKDTTGGSGPYKSSFGPVPGLGKHTMFMPTSIPAGVTLPSIVWGNGACFGYGAWFSKFLNEIASHGFFIIANGAHNGSLLTATSQKDMPDAIDWIYKNAGQGKFAAVDKTKLAAAGQSCGGLQAYQASLDKRVTLTALFNSGLTTSDSKILAKLHAPVGFFTGGTGDGANANSARDYKNMPAKIPTVKSVLPNVGHMATYGDKHGGKFGKAASIFFKWHLKGDRAAAQEFLQPTTLKADGWEIVSKGWDSAGRTLANATKET